MEWIRDNVAQFGGDVSRITVFGQSAGAGMVDFYSYAWANDSIARGFILQSATLDGFPPITNTSATQSWRTVSKAAGCGNDPVAMTECMRTKPTEEIMDALAASANATFNPTEDGVVVFTNYTSRESAGGAYLIGNTENETGFFRLLEANHSDAYWTARNARFYTCSSASRITRTIREGNPSWRYRYFGDFPNVAISVDPPSGAYHTAEVSHACHFQRGCIHANALESSLFSSIQYLPRRRRLIPQFQVRRKRWLLASICVVPGLLSQKIRKWAWCLMLMAGQCMIPLVTP